LQTALCPTGVVW